ncbi:uncharacterized protein LOC126320474 [Schistocerca gregaria]|uniref:uncharacterized protein LOC126320474 n=1 Tax=Schistocerca gregaria TaxID=7010 RepID=UPI00211E4645|nr:uncharacterized protein LOC126320474 [Schistocerca gregaria]
MTNSHLATEAKKIWKKFNDSVVDFFKLHESSEPYPEEPETPRKLISNLEGDDGSNWHVDAHLSQYTSGLSSRRKRTIHELVYQMPNGPCYVCEHCSHLCNASKKIKDDDKDAHAAVEQIADMNNPISLEATDSLGSSSEASSTSYISRVLERSRHKHKSLHQTTKKSSARKKSQTHVKPVTPTKDFLDDSNTIDPHDTPAISKSPSDAHTVSYPDVVKHLDDSLSSSDKDFYSKTPPADKDDSFGQDQFQLSIEWPARPILEDEGFNTFQWVRLNGEKFSIGDSAYIVSGTEEPYISEILELNLTSDNKATCKVVQWQKVADLTHLSGHPQEILRSEFVREHPISAIDVSKKPVVKFTSNPSEIENLPDHFFCYRSYDHKKQTIQNLTIPPDTQ